MQVGEPNAGAEASQWDTQTSSDSEIMKMILDDDQVVRFANVSLAKHVTCCSVAL